MLSAIERRAVQFLAPVLASRGDTIAISFARDECRYDFCLGGMELWPATAAWAVRPASSLVILPEEPGRYRRRAVATRLGTAVVTVSLADTVLGAAIEVVPAFVQLAWEPAIVHTAVRDTVRAAVIARDERGRMVWTCMSRWRVSDRAELLPLDVTDRQICDRASTMHVIAGGERVELRVGTHVATLDVVIDSAAGASREGRRSQSCDASGLTNAEADAEFRRALARFAR